MNGKPCFPPWLSRLTRERYGPSYPNDIPYPIYQVQPTILSADNPNGSAIVKNDAFYQNAAGQIAVANLGTTIIHVMPMDAYDTITIVAFVSPFFDHTHPGAPGVPIFFSFNKPGRITTETQLNGSHETFVATANAFVPTDFSSYPTMVQLPEDILNNTLADFAACYTTLLLPSVKTDRPFYFWFNDGIAQAPPATSSINFNATWYVQGR